MALSFTLKPIAEQNTPVRKENRVLVTGAAGNIGRYFCENAPAKYQLRMVVHDPADCEKLRQYGETVAGELTDLAFAKEVCAGMEVVLHLAGDPSPEAIWSSLIANNLTLTYNMLCAAKYAGCRKLIFASSIHAVSGYPTGVQVKTTDPVNPGDLYGVSKCFGEAVARYFAEQEGLPTIALRIGAFQPRQAAEQKGSIGMADAFLSRRDLQQLIELCIDDTRLQFAIFNALSNNRFNRLDLSDARELLGFQPQDDFFAANPDLEPLDISNKVKDHSLADGQRSGIRQEVGDR